MVSLGPAEQRDLPSKQPWEEGTPVLLVLAVRTIVSENPAVQTTESSRLCLQGLSCLYSL